MSYSVVPLTQSMNQSMTIALPVDGNTVRLRLTITWNNIGGYWFMQVVNAKTNALILDAIPLLPGAYPAANILQQYKYLGIGSCFMVPVGSTYVATIPGYSDLGANYFLVWGDTVPT